jgi:hypothetical protein
LAGLAFLELVFAAFFVVVVKIPLGKVPNVNPLPSHERAVGRRALKDHFAFERAVALPTPRGFGEIGIGQDEREVE